MALTGITNRCLGTMGYEINNKLSKSVESQTTGRRDMSQYQVNLAIAMQSEFSSAKTQGAIQNVRIATEFLRTTDTNLRTTLASLQGATLSAMTLLNGTVSADNKKAAVASLIQTMGMARSPQSRSEAEGTLVKTLRQGGTYYSLTTGEVKTRGTPASFALPTTDFTGGASPSTTFAKAVFSTSISAPSATAIRPAVTVSANAVNTSNWDISVTVGTNTFSETNVGTPSANGTIILKGANSQTLTLTAGGGTLALGNVNAIKAAIEGLFGTGITPTVATAAVPPAPLKPATSNGLAGFSLNPASNFGAGEFTLGYDGEYVTFKDATFGDTMAVVPLAPQALEEASERAAAAGAGATVSVTLGDIGTLQIGGNYKSTGGVGRGASFAAEEYTFPTTAEPLKAVVTVSGNDGTRTLELPNLTDPEILWGDASEIDSIKLETSSEEQAKIKARVDNAVGVVTKAIQDVNNLLQALTEDETGQVATLESLKNTYDTVATADAIETANNVFVETQKYMQMLSAVALVSQVSAQERSAANQIAQLATGG